MSNWFRRIWHLLNRRRNERELVREMHEHRDAMLDPSSFGDTHRLLEQSRDAWGWNWLDDAMQDLKLGVRGLMRAPAFAITGVLILTFGIGLNLTLYQMASVGLIRPPALKNPETLARFRRLAPHSSTTTVPYPITQVVAQDKTVLSAVLVEAFAPVVWGKELTNIPALFVSPNWFSELGTTPSAGRLFSEGVDTATSGPVVVVSHQFWRTQLGSNPDVVGSTIDVNRKPVTVIGVSSPEFTGTDLNPPNAWLVMNQREYYFPDSPFLREWVSDGADLYGRFKEGTSPVAVRERMRALMAGLHQERPDVVAADEWLEPAMASQRFMDARERLGIMTALSILGALTTLVLAVAATNVGNLVLSRATGRSRELGVRVALGAKRSRIVRQLIAETTPLALLGAAGGITLAYWASTTIALVGGMPESVSLAPDWSTIAISLFLSVVTLLVIGAVPAWKVARQELMAAIKDGGQQMSINLDKARLRRFLMAAQVCGSCLILVLAAMMTRTLQRVLSNDLGFEYEHAVTLHPGLGRYGYEGEQAAGYWNMVKARVEQHPEVAALAIALSPPLGGRVSETQFNDAPGLEVISNHVEPAFFSTMEIPLLLGRTFQSGDDPAATVIISRTLAAAMYGSVDVLGRGFPLSEPTATIVGVAGDAHSIRIESAYTSELYRPLRKEDYVDAMLIARSRGDAAVLAPVLREAAVIDSRILPGVELLRDSFERRVTGNRIASAIAVSTGLLTLLIACLGIYGVVSYGATLRVKEFGIHLALGATSLAVLRLVVRQIVWPVAVGAVIGVAAAGPIGVAMTSGPIQLQATDPAAYAGAVLLFLASAIVAALVPAIRVIKSDPVQALRHS
jgi:predicted permease